jgi:hypothetical protein
MKQLARNGIGGSPVDEKTNKEKKYKKKKEKANSGT